MQAIVTGGASPNEIGWATALAFAERGYKVVVTGVSEREFETTPAHDAIRAIVLDVQDDQAVTTLFAGLERIDASVNCAGTGAVPVEHTVEGFVRVVDFNLSGTCVAAHEAFERAGGVVVNLGSMYSFFSSPVAPAYAASKGGVAQLTRSLARAWAPRARGNAVCPAESTPR